MTGSLNVCRRCVLPADYPGADFNADGVCSYCIRSEREPADYGRMRSDAEVLLREAASESAGYHVVVAFSGGKDSSYTLKYFRSISGLRILAVTVDNGYMSPVAAENCRRVTAALCLDHEVIKPSGLGELYLSSLRNILHSEASLARASAVCNTCIRVIDTQLLNLAVARRIPVVAWGFIDGQIAVQGGAIWHDLAPTLPFRRAFLERVAPTVSPEASRLLMPDFRGMERVLLACPMSYLGKSDPEIKEELSELGWMEPGDTGEFSTNCRLNDFAIKEHLKRLGRHPYLFKTAGQVRRGKLSREEALERLGREILEEGLAKLKE